jgi:hypothetical protein
MTAMISERWLKLETQRCVRNYVPIQLERVVVLPFSAEDVATWEIGDVRRRLRFAVRDGLGLHPMVDCFRFEIDGY